MNKLIAIQLKVAVARWWEKTEHDEVSSSLLVQDEVADASTISAQEFPVLFAQY